MDLGSARALVTGGTSGIGYETARQLAAAGANVAVCGRDEQRLTDAAERLGVTAIRADVSVEEDVLRLTREVIDRLGGYDVLINNAAYGYLAPLVDIDPAAFDRMWATNVRGAMLVAREAARHFVTQSYGNIINVASTAGSKGFPGGTAYAGSKFALTGMTECWRAELRKSNVRVMQINPSEVVTGFAAAAGYDQEVNESKLQAGDIAQAILGILALPDRGFVTDLTVWATNPK